MFGTSAFGPAGVMRTAAHQGCEKSTRTVYLPLLRDCVSFPGRSDHCQVFLNIRSSPSTSSSYASMSSADDVRSTEMSGNTDERGATKTFSSPLLSLTTADDHSFAPS